MLLSHGDPAGWERSVALERTHPEGLSEWEGNEAIVEPGDEMPNDVRGRRGGHEQSIGKAGAV